MIVQAAENHRTLKTIALDCDLAVAGGGLAGVCCAITAARAGIRVVLVHDRPVPGGNASSEVRLWILGATSHMGNNNRWAREGGVIDEILVENMYRNPEGNPLLVDVLLLEMLTREPNLTLLLNTSVLEVTKRDADAIESIRAFCSQNSTMYEIRAPLFCDASGDGVVGFLAGAAFRMGAESRDEFCEMFAPTTEYGELLGHSLYFYSKDVGRPITYIPPSFALSDITKIPRFRSFNAKDIGCRLWWIEYGGRLDTVHETETIKWELWKIVYGVWDHIKNSGRFPEAENLALEWVGNIPGKRESRRFEGDYMLVQQDVVEQRRHDDDVSFGGWSIDLHPADGIFSEKPGCNQWHAKGVYPIPYRCMYSRNVANLFLAGRVISASHVAFGSSRVMATCAHGAQAVGMAGALCVKHGLLPRDLCSADRMRQLQRELIRVGQYIPNVRLDDAEDLALTARISVSSQLQLQSLPPSNVSIRLNDAWAMMLPVPPGPITPVAFVMDVSESTTLAAELRVSSRAGNNTPDVTLATHSLSLRSGDAQTVWVRFDAHLDAPQYAFFILHANSKISVRTSEARLTGVLSLTHAANKAVAKSATQNPPEEIGIDSFEFWLPRRRPEGRNLAISLEKALDAFGPENLTNGIARPTNQPNAWVADPKDAEPVITLAWKEVQTIGRFELTFDADYDHPMESVLMGHPEQVMPFCVREYQIQECAGNIVAARRDNHMTRNTIVLGKPLRAQSIEIRLKRPSPNTSASLFEVRCYRV